MLDHQKQTHLIIEKPTNNTYRSRFSTVGWCFFNTSGLLAGRGVGSDFLGEVMWGQTDGRFRWDVLCSCVFISGNNDIGRVCFSLYIVLFDNMYSLICIYYVTMCFNHVLECIVHFIMIDVIMNTYHYRRCRY